MGPLGLVRVGVGRYPDDIGERGSGTWCGIGQWSEEDREAGGGQRWGRGGRRRTSRRRDGHGVGEDPDVARCTLRVGPAPRAPA